MAFMSGSMGDFGIGSRAVREMRRRELLETTIMDEGDLDETELREHELLPGQGIEKFRGKALCILEHEKRQNMYNTSE